MFADIQVSLYYFTYSDSTSWIKKNLSQSVTTNGGYKSTAGSLDSSEKSALPALPSKKPYPPPPIGKKPIPSKPDITKQSTIDNKELSRSCSSPKGSTSNLSENKSRDKESHREKDKDDKGFPDFDNLDLPPSEKLVHLTANRVKQPNKRPPSQVFLHTAMNLKPIVIEEEKNELKDSKEKESFRGDKKSAALTAVSLKEEKKISGKDDRKSMPSTPPLPPGIHSSKSYKKEENKEEAKRPVSYVSSSSSSVTSVIEQQKLRSPSLSKKTDISSPSDVGAAYSSDNLKELLEEIKELKANMVTRSSFQDLQAENEKLRQDLESVKTTLHRKVRDIIFELDEEKKVRLNMQVEIDRMKKLVSESTI
ncbi:SH3KBP1 [Acanthosepion pharaonis]|uniref:SH3KBP1 n=1 Tax=Acanthosepion pharaonis TaxID=158019 RepID=A0A812EWD7_ACAPH|nr:SH3KBP1 [Sepia pharaonis]